MKESALSEFCCFRGKRLRMVSTGTKMRALVPLLPSFPTLASTPITSKRMPFSSMVAPTAGRPGNTFLSSSQPTTATLRCSVLSSALSHRPVPRGTLRIWLYSGVTHRPNVLAVDHRRHEAQSVGLITDREVIFVGEVISLTGLQVPRHRRNSSRKDEHDVLAEGREVPYLAAAETLSQTHQQQQGADTPGNTEHGQKRA